MNGDRKLNPAAFELRKEIVKSARKYFELVHGPKPFPALEGAFVTLCLT